MCGIIGFAGKGNASTVLLKGLSKLEYRGYDSAGITLLENNRFSTYKTTKRIESLKSKIDSEGEIGIGHTRWATHGAPTAENAHPHLSENGKFAVVHNGIIENYQELKSELIGEGFTFKSETDTEVIPQLLEKYYNGDIKEAVLKTVSRLKGAFALGILCIDYPDLIVGVKNFSPLIIGIGESQNLIASDILALRKNAEKTLSLEDGEIVLLTSSDAVIYSFNGIKITRRTQELNQTLADSEKGEYPHFMLKEIMEQPDAIRRALSGRVVEGEIYFENSGLTAERLKNINLIQIAACGSAYHAALVGKYVLEELLRIPVLADHASEFRYRNPVVDEKTLTVVISQSGETADTLAALKEAKRRGSYTLAIVNVPESTIAKAADEVLLTNAGPEIAVATTKGYTTQLCLLYLLAIKMASLLDTADKKYILSLIKELNLIPQKISKCLKLEADIAEKSRLITEAKSVFFIGRNIDYATSLEAGLKLKEISYIHSESYPSGELKHGTISLIEVGTPVFALCCYERLLEKQLSNIKEVTARGGKVICCVTENNPICDPELGINFAVPETDPLFTAVLEVIPFQLLAYYTALHKGLDIDKPRNLAKSVTVE